MYADMLKFVDTILHQQCRMKDSAVLNVGDHDITERPYDAHKGCDLTPM